MKGKLLVILGPTATGKTDLALQLASKFQGELVACDSRQVYKGLDIGTGKLPGGVLSSKYKVLRVKKGKNYWEVNGVKIWMYDVVDPKVQYTVADYIQDAGKVVDEIHGRGKLPIVVGGTGLYLKALLEGIPNLSIPVDKKLRKKLEKLSVGEMQEQLRSLSPSRWKNLNQSDRQNPRRLLRSIELAMMNPYMRESLESRVKSQGKTNKNARPSTLATGDYLKIGLTAPRDVLYKNIDSRVLSRIDQGMISEAEKLNNDGLSLKRMRQLGLEYGVLADYLEGKIKTTDELIKIMQGKIHGYVRRQLTWFKREKDIHWFDISEGNWMDKVEKRVIGWYNG